MSEPAAVNETAESSEVADTQAGISPDPALMDWLRAEHEGYTEGLRFAAGEIDLNADGAVETLVYVAGPMVCGSGGCNAYVLQKEGEGYVKISGHTVSNLPIGAFDTQTNGWRDLAITVRGGIMEEGPDTGRLSYDGTRYPLNSTVLPAERADQPFEIVLPFVEWEELQLLP
ncbi:hypothetical protein [Aurantiacibacter sp. MUD61]|uniref:hypothetical protein n=1 Tax=Aurantiacibacter sp. MUD61 TaxID=3009083 RepID=UPI0022F03488|nr:hypothetical protein [Aurantiacibacter sp. MUD61]